MSKKDKLMLTNSIDSNTNQLRYNNTREQMNSINMEYSNSSNDSFIRQFGPDDKKTKLNNAEKSIKINIINDLAINGTQREFSSSNVSNDKRCIRNEEQNSANNNTDDLVNLMTESNMQNSINAKLNNNPTFFIDGISIKNADQEINMKDHEKTIENALKNITMQNRPIENERQNNVENSFSFGENNNSIEIPIENERQNNVENSFSFGENNRYIRNEEQNSSNNDADLVNFMIKSNMQNRPIENKGQNNTNKKLSPVSHGKNKKLQNRSVLSEIVNGNKQITRRNYNDIYQYINRKTNLEMDKQVKQDLLDVKNKKNKGQNNTNQKPSPVSHGKNKKLQHRTVLSEIVNGNKQITQKNRNGTNRHIKRNISSSMIDQQVKQTKQDLLDVKNKRKQKVKSNYYIPAKGQYEETKKILNKVKNNNTYRRYCSNGIK